MGVEVKNAKVVTCQGCKKDRVFDENAEITVSILSIQDHNGHTKREVVLCHTCMVRVNELLSRLYTGPVRSPFEGV